MKPQFRYLLAIAPALVMVPAFVARFRSSEEAQALKQGRWTISYLYYDWSLNEAVR